MFSGWIGTDGGFWLPRQGSTGAGGVDAVFNAVTSIAVFFFVLITVVLVYFVWKYRKREGHRAEASATHNQTLEVTWTVIPVLIVVWIFWKGFAGYLDLQTPPQNAYEVQVLGQKWKWLFTYPNGVVDDNLHVPPGEPVRLVMTSQDVIHSLYIPDFRIKRDAVPGRYEKEWFQANDPGEYQIFCAEYCGTSHSAMLATVIVHRSRQEFETWLADAANFLDKLPPEKLWEGGQKLYGQRGCKQCHSVDGASGIGPTFKGIWGHAQPIQGGGSETVDENYVRESILTPQAKIVAGYEPVMPTYKGRLTDKEITAIIEYLKTLPVAVENAMPPKDHYLNHTSGFASWAFTLDHKRIGIMYLVATLGSFLLGGLAALAVRTELISRGPTIMDADTYNKTFTLHGAVMVFLFIIPSIPAALGNFVLPLMLGAKDVAFPRMNLLSFWLWIVGALFCVGAVVAGGVDTGWTFYTPYSTTTNTNVVATTFGAFILGFSSIFTGLNFIVTIHKLRPSGMTWFKMPLFLWSLYGTAIIQVLATPVLGITLLLLIAERVLGVGIFDPALGGDPVLFQHFFWFYSHPAVYIMILPAMGIISEVISIHSRKHIFGYRFIALSSIAIAAFGFLVWGHHMFVSGQSGMADAVFSALTFSVAIPSAIKVFNWLATLYKGDIRLNTAMIYGLMFLITFGIGGLTGLHLGALAVDVHLHDTYFVVAHFHYVMFGGTVIALLAGLHHWWPKMFGVMFDERQGRIGAALIFIGFNVTFFTQFMMGSHGMPRRYYDYLPQFTIYHRISTVGSYVMAAGFFLIAYYLLRSLFRGEPAPMNPWGGNSLEWHTSSPPPHDNFATTPVAEDPYDYSNLVEDVASASFRSRTYEGASA